MNERRRAFVLIALVALLILCVLYLIGVRTFWGQRIDATALQGSRTLQPRPVRATGRLLATIDIASVVLIGSAIVLVAVARGRPYLAIGSGIVMAGSVVTSELLKHIVLTRPYLGVIDPLGRRPSFPSGHTTIAMSLAIAAMLVTPVRARGWVGLVGATYASAIGIAVVATANHRPVDVIGGVCVVTIWTSVVAASLTSVSRTVPRESQGTRLSPALAVAGVAALAVAFVALLATFIALRRSNLDTVEIRGALFGAAAAIVGAVYVATAALGWTLRGVTLDPPPAAAASVARETAI